MMYELKFIKQLSTTSIKKTINHLGDGSDT